MVLAFSFIGSTAIATNNFKTEVNVNNSDNWELVKEENGIKAYIKEYESFLGSLAVKIKFENSTNQEVKLSWSLINQGSKRVLSENNTQLKANGTIVIIDENKPFSVNIGEKTGDFTINLNILQ